MEPEQKMEVGQPSDNEFEKRRYEFLQRMYSQMFDDIKVQLQIVWQAVAVVAGTFALFGLVEKGIMPLDVAVSIIVLIASWMIAHVIEASYWYNRNLVIIANIERQFLKQSDLRNIHYYFGKHRKKGAMIYHLWIQFFLGACLALTVVFYHFFDRVYPGLSAPWENLQLQRSLPYVVSITAVIALSRHSWYKNKEYDEFIGNSPGIEVATDGIVYDKGHPAA